jgi:hypothetical protein
LAAGAEKVRVSVESPRMRRAKSSPVAGSLTVWPLTVVVRSWPTVRSTANWVSKPAAASLSLKKLTTLDIVRGVAPISDRSMVTSVETPNFLTAIVKLTAPLKVGTSSSTWPL